MIIKYFLSDSREISCQVTEFKTVQRGTQFNNAIVATLFGSIKMMQKNLFLIQRSKDASTVAVNVGLYIITLGRMQN